MSTATTAVSFFNKACNKCLLCRDIRFILYSIKFVLRSICFTFNENKFHAKYQLSFG